ncbi:hypothetical protein ADLECEL_17380 [Adlercreutzia equolifaciens subsp. celatus]|uniref:tRNA lysidine(34) synthetase n=1 Tax=Adlercreutzia equolifaciens TaxID=446660 RepID=UPI001AFB4B64|nr:ATP-binding protein [Adlercreutzia equolifaciens]BCS57853.1 hypothetical protein ADLECEL_17380 [Adlercreutzia equolifaciens subsp. celatus]
MTDVLEKARATIAAHDLAAPDAAVLLMVSGGSDSTALAYLGAALREAGDVGPVAMLHVNHQLRGEDADGDERFVAALAEALDIPLFICSIDIAAEAERSRENVEAVARRERYLAANEALRSMCQHEGRPLSEARIFTAHTADDRIENFYMRSIVGTGPGGFRSMLYRNGPVVRPPARRHPRRAARLPCRPGGGGGRRWCATSPGRSGARTPPTPTPIASAPTCATRSCRRPRNGTARCPRC